MLDIQEKIKELEKNGSNIFSFVNELLIDYSFYQAHFLYPQEVMRMKDTDLIKEVLYRKMYKGEKVFITDNPSKLRSRQNGALQE